MTCTCTRSGLCSAHLRQLPQPTREALRRGQITVPRAAELLTIRRASVRVFRGGRKR
jgi:hypothetical protein